MIIKKDVGKNLEYLNMVLVIIHDNFKKYLLLAI